MVFVFLHMTEKRTAVIYTAYVLHIIDMFDLLDIAGSKVPHSRIVLHVHRMFVFLWKEIVYMEVMGRKQCEGRKKTIEEEIFMKVHHSLNEITK